MDPRIDELFSQFASAFHDNDLARISQQLYLPCTFVGEQGSEVIGDVEVACQSFQRVLEINQQQPISSLDFRVLECQHLSKKLLQVKVEWLIQQQPNSAAHRIEGHYFVIDKQQQLKLLSVITDQAAGQQLAANAEKNRPDGGTRPSAS